jgi:hypothetical protein
VNTLVTRVMIGYDHACDFAQVTFYRLRGSYVQRVMVWVGKAKLLERTRECF